MPIDVELEEQQVATSMTETLTREPDTARAFLAAAAIANPIARPVSAATTKHEAPPSRVSARLLPALAGRFTARARHAGVLARRSRLLLRDPHAETFTLVGATARWHDAMGMLAVTGAASGILYTLAHPIVGGMARALATGALIGAVALVLLAPLGALVLAAITAPLGGRGSLRTSCYLVALACSPLLPLGMAAYALPMVGALAGTAVSLYGVALAVLATSTAYRLSYARALLAVFASMLLLTAVLLLALVAFLFVSLKAALAG